MKEHEECLLALQVSRHVESQYNDLDVAMRPMLGTHTASKVCSTANLDRTAIKSLLNVNECGIATVKDRHVLSI